MNLNSLYPIRVSPSLLSTSCLLLSAAFLQAADITKDTSGTDLLSPASWAGGVVPKSTDVATWAGGSLGAGLTLGANTNWLGMKVTGAASDINIAGAGILTLSGSGLDASNSPVNVSLGVPVTLGAAQNWGIAAGQTVTVSGVLAGTGALTKGGPGSLVLSGANTQSGATTIRAGSLTLSGNRTANSAAITVGADINPATLNLQAGTFSFAGTALSAGAGTLTTPGNNTNGIVNQTGSAISFASGNAVLVGGGSNTAGIYNLSGGSITGYSSATRGVILGVNVNCLGVFNLSGTGNLNLPAGALVIARRDSAANNTAGIFNQTGGSAIVNTLLMGSANANSNGVAKLILLGGTFTNNAFNAMSAGGFDTSSITIGGTADVTLPAFPTARGFGSTATITFDGGLLRPKAASATYLSGLDHAYLTANGANFNVSAGNDITIMQTLENAPSQAGALTKDGAGVLTLAGFNSYTGPTTVKGGNLRVNNNISSPATLTVQNNAILSGSYGTVTGPVKVNSGGAIAPGDSAGAGTLAVGPLTLGTTAGDTQNINITFTGGSVSTLNVSGAVNNNGTTTINIATIGTVPAGVYPLITYSGTTITSGFVLGTKPAGSSLQYSANSIDLVITDSLKWTGLENANWDTASTNWQWVSAATPAKYTDGVGLLFDDTLTTYPDINLATTVTPGGVLFNNDLVNYSLSGPGSIAGSIPLIKNGSGLLSLFNANTHTGGTTLQGLGMLGIGNSRALGTGPLRLQSAQTGASVTLVVSGGIEVTNPIVIDATAGREAIYSTNGNNTLSGGIEITGSGGGAYYLSSSGTVPSTFAISNSINGPAYANAFSLRGAEGNSGIISGQINLPLCQRFQIIGSANWTITSTGNAWPETRISSGVGGFILGADNALSPTAKLTFDADTSGAVDLAGHSQTVAGLNAGSVISPPPSVGNSSTTTDALLRINGAGLTFAGILVDTLGSGTRKLSVEFLSGTQTLIGENTYTGPTVITGGTLNIGNGSTFGSLSASTEITNSGTLGINRIDDIVFANKLTGTGALTKSGAGILTLAGQNTLSGLTTVSAGTLLASNLSGTVTVASGAKLGAGAGNTITPLTIAGDLNLTTATLLFDINSSADMDKIVVAGNLTPSGTSPITINSPTTLPNGEYTLIEVAGTLGGTAANFSVVSQAPKFYSIAFVAGTPNRVVLQVAGDKTWVGDGAANVWNVNTTPNWVETTALTPDVFANGDAARFYDLSTNLNVSIPGIVSPGSTTITSTNNYTFTGAGGIAGTGGLTVNGTNRVTMSTANSFSGTVSVGNYSSLVITNASALGTGPKLLSIRSNPGKAELHLNGSAGPITLPADFTITTYGDNTTTSVIDNEAGDNVIEGDIGMPSGGGQPKITVTSGSLTLKGTIANTRTSSGGKVLYLAGTGTNLVSGLIRDHTIGSARSTGMGILGGTWIFSNNNLYTAGTTIGTNGTLLLTGSLATSPVTVQNGGTLRGNGSMNGTLTVQAGGLLAPGTTIGTLTVNNIALLQGTTVLEIARNGAVLTNDLITGLTTLTNDGALVITNVGSSPLQAGDTFKLLGATTYAGAYTNIVLPEGYTFTNRLALDGTISVLTSPVTEPPTLSYAVSGGNWVFTWTAPGFKLQAQTNTLDVGLSTNWADVPGGDVSGVSVPGPVPGNPVVFFRLISNN